MYLTPSSINPIFPFSQKTTCGCALLFNDKKKSFERIGIMTYILRFNNEKGLQFLNTPHIEEIQDRETDDFAE